MGKLSDATKRNSRTPTRLKFFRVLSPFFLNTNKDRKTAWVWLGLMLVLLVLESWFLVAFSYTQVRRRHAAVLPSVNCCGCTTIVGEDATCHARGGGCVYAAGQQRSS